MNAHLRELLFLLCMPSPSEAVYRTLDSPVKLQRRHQLRIVCYPLGWKVCVDKWQMYGDALS